MNAQQAKQQALSVSEGANKEAYDKAIIAIHKAVSNGNMECQVYEVLSIGVANQLRALGYKVDFGIEKNESYTTISWKDAN